jgi:hypothetical protein
LSSPLLLGDDLLSFEPNHQNNSFWFKTFSRHSNQNILQVNVSSWNVFRNIISRHGPSNLTCSLRLGNKGDLHHH